MSSQTDADVRIGESGAGNTTHTHRTQARSQQREQRSWSMQAGRQAARSEKKVGGDGMRDVDVYGHTDAGGPGLNNRNREE